MIRPEEARRPLTVTELAFAIKRELGPLSAVIVKGEVTGMKLSAKGHYSFTIRDPGAVIEAFLFADTARRLGIVPEDGQEFIFRGRVDFWPQGGRLRLVVDFIQFDDVGKMRAQLEALKQGLELEGAFAPERKRALPYLPLRVALVTSPTGAVIHDLQETIWDRYPNMGVLVYPAQVQGTASPGSVAVALRRCNQEGLADVVVIARGGGSFEELYAFNTEPVARAILASEIPVVTALGHTSDRTIADMVADAECRTPTEAGARVVPRKSDLVAALVERGRRLDRESRRRLEREAEHLASREQRLRQVLPDLIRSRAERLARCRAELARLSPVRQVARREEQLRQLGIRIDAAGQRTLRDAGEELARIGPRIDLAVLRTLRDAGQGLAHRADRLGALSPERVLGRGYSITLDAETGTVLRSAGETAAGRRIRVRLAAGSVGALVEGVQP
jgi:exodeoxyribonuclease VII large subunit